MVNKKNGNRFDFLIKIETSARDSNIAAVEHNKMLTEIRNTMKIDGALNNLVIFKRIKPRRVALTLIKLTIYISLLPYGIYCVLYLWWCYCFTEFQYMYICSLYVYDSIERKWSVKNQLSMCKGIKIILPPWIEIEPTNVSKMNLH